MSAILRVAVGLVAATAAGLCGLFAVMAIGDAVQGVAVHVSLVLAGVFTLGATGGMLVYWRLVVRRPTGPEPHEQAVLSLALEYNGRLTVALLAARSTLSVADSRRALEHLALAGVAEVGFDAAGAVIYTFTGLTPEETRGACSP